MNVGQPVRACSSLNFAKNFLTHVGSSLPPQVNIREHSQELRGPATVLFISRDTCSDSIAKLFRPCFYGVSHNYRAMGYRTDAPV